MRILGAVVAVSLATAVSAATAEPPAPSPTDPPPSAAAAPASAVSPNGPAAAAQPAALDPPASPCAGSTAPRDSETAADLAAARAASAGPRGPRVARGGPLPAESEVTIDRRNAVVAGARFGGPIGATLRLSLLHGLGAKVNEKDGKVDAVCSVPIPHCAGGFLLDAEAGSGGGKLSLGIGGAAKVQDEDFRGTVGAGLKLSLARTWGHPLGTEAGTTYLGPELDFYVLRAGVNLGVLWRVAGDGGRTALFSWGVGLRL